MLSKLMVGILASGLACGLPGFSFAQTAPVAVVPRPQLMKGVDAFPRLVPNHSAASAINKALSAADARVSKAAKECFAEQKNQSWTRKISVTMTGPRYLAYIAVDDISCGGAHPGRSLIALTFDLGTGKPVNWLPLFPAAAKAVADQTIAADRTRIGVIASESLSRRYVSEQTAPGTNPECHGILKETSYQFQLWPDAATRSLVFDQDDLPFAAAACGGSMTVPLEELRKSGYAKELIDALQEAVPPSGR